LLYTINTKTSSLYRPIRVIGEPARRSLQCASGKGGKLSGAAYDFAKGEKEVPEYGISIKIDGLEEQSYKITLNWKRDFHTKIDKEFGYRSAVNFGK
jgi:hypothetical protein